jgi:hypothetical protein
LCIKLLVIIAYSLVTALKELSSSNNESQIAAPNLKDEAVISSVPISSSDDEEEEEDEMNLKDESYDPFDPLS